MLTKFNPPDLAEVFPKVVVRGFIRVDVWDINSREFVGVNEEATAIHLREACWIHNVLAISV
jgi:hypothetical protein